MRKPGEWKPKAKRVRSRSLLLADFTRSLLRPWSSAASMPARAVRMLLASLIKGARPLRVAIATKPCSCTRA